MNITIIDIYHGAYYHKISTLIVRLLNNKLKIKL